MRALFVPGLCLLVLSCSVRQEIDLKADGAGTVSVAVELLPAFADWAESMGEEAQTLGLKKAGAGAVFDEAAIRAGAASFDGVTVTRLAIPSRERLELELAFASLSALGRGSSLVSLSGAGGRRRLTIRLDAAGYAAIKPLIPGADNQLLDVLGPQAENPYTEREYDEVLAFTAGDDAPQWVRASRIEAIVRVPGRVVAQSGGRIEGGAVRFVIPLLDVLLLRKPLVYTIEYEPLP